MKSRTVVFYVGLILVAVVLTPSHKKGNGSVSTDVQSGGNPSADRTRIVESYGKLPLNFEVNQGQTDPQVKFLSRGSGYTLFLAPTEAVLALRQPKGSNPRQKLDRVPAGLEPEAAQAQAPAVLRMKLIGANSAPRLVGLDQLPGKSNYFIGNDPKKWRTNVPNYSKVRYENVYAGVDLIYYGRQGQLEYDFVVAPGAAPGAITLDLEGAEGMAIDPHGNLILSMVGGELSLHKPVVYQEVNGVRREIQGGYVLREGSRVGFQVAAYDAAKPLVIDPTLAYSTYLGGLSADGDFGLAIAVDGSGNAYVTGGTSATNFPTTMGAFQTAFGGGMPGLFNSDAFVTKFDAAGALVYSTYLGGSGDDVGRGIAVDSPAGNAYVTGQTDSTNFPTAMPFQAAGGGGTRDGFVTKLDPTGSGLVYSTYLGGSINDDAGNGIAVDSSGNAYVTGSTFSINFPTSMGAFKTACDGNEDAFVAKFSPTGSRLYSTCLGGNVFFEVGVGIAVDGSGNAYVTGVTASTDFPTTMGAFQTALNGSSDAFVTKLNATGTALVYSTYLGGSSAEFAGEIGGIAVDSPGGNAYVTGTTASTDFPTTLGSFQTAFGGGVRDAFVTKLNATGTALVYSTYLGGSGDEDFGAAIAVDSSGNAYVTGQTNSTNFPTANPIVFQRGLFGNQDAFVTQFNPSGSALVYSTYLTGLFGSSGSGIAVDSPAGNAYVTGQTGSSDFPTTAGAFQSSSFDRNAFVAKIAPAGLSDLAVTQTDSPDPVTTGADVTYTITVTNNGPDAATGVTLNDLLPSGLFPVSSTPSQGSCNDGNPVDACALGTLASGATATVTIVVTTTAPGTITNNVSVRSNVGDPATADNSAAATTTVSSGGPNTPPVATDDSFMVNEDQVLNAAAPGVLANDTDADNNPLTAVLDTTTSNGLLALNANGSFTYTPNANFNGMDSFTYHANDGLADSNIATVTLTINPVNDAPSFTAGPNQTALEDAGAQSVAWATNLSAGPADEAGQTLAFMVTNNNNALFSAQPSVNNAGTLSYTPAANANGVATVTVTLMDNGGTANGGVDTSAAQMFTITITAVNDAPSFTPGPDQGPVLAGSGAQTVNNWATNVSAGPANESGQTLTFSVSNNNNAIFSAQPAISSAGTLTYTPAATGSGVATVTVTLMDNGGTANGGVDTSPAVMFTITVNDFGLAANPNQGTITAGQSFMTTIAATALGAPVTQTATYGCTGLPFGATCVFNPPTANPVALAPGTNTMLTFNTMAPSTARLETPPLGRPLAPLYALWLLAPGVTGLGLVFAGGRRSKHRRAGPYCLLAVLLVMMGLLAACGNHLELAPLGGTPAGTYNVTVTATAGSVQRTTQVMLTVQ